MNTKCECPQHGFCELRQRYINRGLHKECQAGKFDLATRLAEEIDKPRSPRPVLPLNERVVKPNKSTIGTQIKKLIETTSGLKITCGECLSYILSLNKDTTFDPVRVSKYLAANVPWHDRLSYTQLVVVMEELITPVLNNVNAKVTDNSILKFSDSDWVTVVTTSPREEPTIQLCLDSIVTAGWNPVVFAEPDSVNVEGYTYRNNTTRLGAWHNWLQSVRWALEKTTAKYILSVQDDSLFHPDSRSFVESIMWPSNKTGFVSLYTAKHYSENRSGDLKPVGVNKIETSSLWGACALVFSRESLTQVVSHPLVEGWTGIPPAELSDKAKLELVNRKKENPYLIQNVDSAIGKIVNGLHLEMYMIDPSPVTHVSKFSSIGHSNNNTGKRNCIRCADHSKPLAIQVFPK